MFQMLNTWIALLFCFAAVLCFRFCSLLLLLFLFLANTSYETANGIKGQEAGTLKKATSPDSSDVIITQGSVSYTAPDGTLITLTYVADDIGGFQPQASLFCFNLMPTKRTANKKFNFDDQS